MEHQYIIQDKAARRRYFRGKLLGTGGFATCYEVREEAGARLFAAKVLPKEFLYDQKQRRKVHHEIRIQRGLKHPFIVQLQAYFEDKANIYILQELCPHSTLKELLKRRRQLTLPEARLVFRQVVEAVDYLHRKGIVHRDLKLGNVMLGPSLECKLGDFGLSAKLKGQSLRHTICGTPNYIAPEIIEQKGHSFEVDLWSLGVILYALLYGKPPFETNSSDQTYQRILNVQYSFPKQGYSLANKLIDSLLRKNQKERASLAEVMAHPFFIAESQLERLPLSALAVPPASCTLMQPEEDGPADSQVDLRVAQDISGEWGHVYVSYIQLMQQGIGYRLSSGSLGILLYSGGGIVIHNGKTYPVDGKEQVQLEDEQVLLRLKLRAGRPRQGIDGPPIYLLKYIKTSGGFLFKLSNGHLQMLFPDGSLIAGDVLKGGSMLFRDKEGRELTGEAGGRSFQKRMGVLLQTLRRVEQKISKG